MVGVVTVVGGQAGRLSAEGRRRITFAADDPLLQASGDMHAVLLIRGDSAVGAGVVHFRGGTWEIHDLEAGFGGLL